MGRLSARRGRCRLPRNGDDSFKCPMCGARICWAVPGGSKGSTGYAHCSRSIVATHVWKLDEGPPDCCPWNGDAERDWDGSIDIWDDMSWVNDVVQDDGDV